MKTLLSVQLKLREGHGVGKGRVVQRTEFLIYYNFKGNKSKNNFT